MSGYAERGNNYYEDTQHKKLEKQKKIKHRKEQQEGEVTITNI